MYIDPNTGGILFQALAGALVAVSGVLFIFSRRIKEGIAKLRRRSRENKEETQE
ncbi:MAG: LPXTG cell wall anchor domain-containing protein [Anaerolineales bacterium]|nr:LPXTG cell wall anchor domain-containing protein [Anaerolineales bacterium]